MHNSNREDFRPISIGTDTKTAAYYREYRQRIKDRDEHPLLMAPEGNMTYAEIAEKAHCKQQTVINHLKKHGWDDKVTQVSQKKYVPLNIGQYLIAEITGKEVPQEVLDSLHLDG